MIALSDEIKASVSLVEEFEKDGHELKREGNRFVLCCPFHEEKTPSCKVSLDTDRYHCFGCGADGTVIDYHAHKLGITPAEAIKDLASRLTRGERGAHQMGKPSGPRSIWQPYRMNEAELVRCVAMAEALLNDDRAIKGIAKTRGWSAETIRHLALDPCLGIEGGKLVSIYPTGAKKRLKPLTPSAAEHKGAPFTWLFGKPDALWRADRILRCTERVHVTEGETAAISLIDAGIDNGETEIAVGSPGASSWRKEWATLFRGKHVTIWPDADDAGQKHAAAIISSVSSSARSIEIVPVGNEVQP